MKNKSISGTMLLLALGFLAVSCDDDSTSSPQCGNGIVETGEVCDLLANVPATCAAFDSTKQWISGTPACAPDCKSVTQGSCLTALIPTSSCGNGLLDAGEQCEPALPVTASCSAVDPSKTWIAGSPACSNDCKITIGTCQVASAPTPSTCGNNRLDPGETCDNTLGVPADCSRFDPSKSWKSGAPACATDCMSITQGTCTENTDTPTDPVDPNITSADTVTTERCNLNSNDFVETCNGQTARFCSESGYVTLRDCSKLTSASNPLTCQVSAEDGYADCVAECTPAEFIDYNTCQGKYVATNFCLKAQNGKSYIYTFTNDPCPVACNNGFCTTETAPTPGQACPQNFKPSCFSNSIYDCVGNVISKTDCPASTTCAMQFGDPKPVCAQKCSLYDVDSSTYACTNVNNQPATQNHVCRVATDSKYYWFDESETCKSSCSDGVCDRPIPQIGSSCSDMDDLCAHNTVYYCRSDTHVVDVMECGIAEYIGSPFCRYLDASYADCVVPCEEGTEPQMDCGGSNARGTAYTDNYICKKGLDGTFYWFHDEESCPNGCEKGVCL